MDERFAHDRFLVDQLIRPMINLYRVTPLAAGETPAGGPVAYVRQKRMAIKEDIRFYADENESEEVFRIKARSMFDIGGSRYDVTTPEGGPIGVLEHSFRKSLFRSTWKVTDADGGEVVTAQERSLPMAIARRVVDFVPYGEWLPIPYNFDLLMDGRAIDGSASRSPSVWTLCRTARSSWGKPCFPHEPPSFRLANATGSSAPGGTRSRLRAQASLDQGRDQGRSIQPADSDGKVETWARPPNGCERSAARCSATGSPSV